MQLTFFYRKTQKEIKKEKENNSASQKYGILQTDDKVPEFNVCLQCDRPPQDVTDSFRLTQGSLS